MPLPPMTDLEDVPSPQGQLTLKVLAPRQEVNVHGDIPAGWLINQMDQACEIVAGRQARGRTATVAVESMDFLSPVRVGAEVNLYTAIRHVGRSSMQIDVEVWTRPHQESDPNERHKVTEARFVVVALDDNGRIRAVSRK